MVTTALGGFAAHLVAGMLEQGTELMDYTVSTADAEIMLRQHGLMKDAP
jgi:hypothetical protein